MIKDITNTVFGKNAVSYQRGYFRVKENMWLWCPHLSIMEAGQATSTTAGWLNILAEDWSYIDESHQNEEIVKKRPSYYMKGGKSDEERAVFAKYKDNLGFNRYRFVGLYILVGISPKDEKYIRYLRISDHVKIKK